MEKIFDFSVEQNLPVKMCDGVTLYADVYRPKSEGKFPVILMRLPYEKEQAENITYAHPSWYARHGYIVVSQDVRGRYKSEGDFNPLRNEANDGYDTVEWAAKLPGSNGKVGMYGFSYSGATQYLAAVEQPPHLVCICPALTGSDYYNGWTYRGGALHLAFTTSWSFFLGVDTARRLKSDDLERAVSGSLMGIQQLDGFLPLKEFPGLKEVAPYFYDWINHDTYDSYWKEISIEPRYSKINVPALHIDGWYDIFLDGELKNYASLMEKSSSEEARKNQKLIIGPWYHMPWSQFSGMLNFGDEAQNHIDDIQLRWFDYWLKGESNGIMDEPRVSIFVMGENRWRQENEWPLARTQYTPYYLHSKGRANSINGDGYLDTNAPQSNEVPDIYTYDPRNPVSSMGGHSCCIAPLTPMGATCQRGVEIRNDVLVYSTEVLEDDVEVTGPIKATLWASSSAVDTDFTMKLVDVYPDDRAINIQEGIIRARYRNSLEKPELIEPNKIYEYEINLSATSNVFKKGHRILIEVSSSNFPTFDRNPNTGKSVQETKYSDFETATQTIYHDSQHPSCIILPIIAR